MKQIVFAVFVITVSFACDGSKATAKTDKTETLITYQTLADLLRNQPGIKVQGYGANVTVIIRGETSIEDNNEPLFVLDGNPIGNTYALASQNLDPNEIDRIRVLSAARAGLYGSRGGNGVIEMFSKK